ncbi:flavocytochrome c [Pelagimonas varians]|uniref:Fumarate reductase flavoprotein subunit n=1 Tax=Pelagimonas varians TaxID=696760 RepID=A0A238JX71_9RHOB|nr:flavocytochrome c [Pelagimonas varians]PYG34358.1 flavocytochrome c [Pelagimonas varians]SMX34306.1 Fumarate reductase flavoprotein subunit precursor [Pelagimonas varians]
MSDKIKNRFGKSVTRREILGAGAAVGATIALGSGAKAAPMPESWDEEVDVVIVGTGFAGLAAAYEAQKAGASVALLEKMRTPGGNSIINGGVFSAAGSPQQADEGIEDSAELLYQDMLKAGLYLNHPELARLAAEKSVETWQWTVDEIGAEWVSDLRHMGGHSVPRAYKTKMGTGAGVVVPLLAKLAEMGVEPRTRALLKNIIRDDDGRVKGVVVHDGFRHPDLESGTPKTIKANRGVILATGGFGNDLAFRTMQDPRLDASVDTTNHPGATAEALREGMNIGAFLIQPSWVQLGPWTSADEKGFGRSPYFVQSVTAAYGLWVNWETGRRFVNELADRKTRADAIIAEGNKAIAFCDAGGYKVARRRLGDKMLDGLKSSGVVKEYPTLEAMAEEFGTPLASLQATIERFNASVDAGKDAEMGRYMQKDQFRIGAGPFYAVRLLPKVHHTMGGLAISARAEALDVVSMEPIPGLFVAGEAAGGVHGASRLGSCAFLDCLVFGRIAGQNAASMNSWS